MKILNAIHAQGIGGVDQVFRNYAEILSQSGHEVALLISENGHENYAARKIFKLKNFSQILDCLHLLWILRHFKPDLILCHSNRLMKWMRILRFFSATKSIAINHGISFKNSLHCDYAISINHQISDLVIAAGFDQSRVLTLSNAIKIDQNYRQKTAGNPPRIGIYGRIEPRKGFDILIEACGLLAKTGRDFRLKIGGFEPVGNCGTQALEQLTKIHDISEKCEFVGVVLDKKKFFDDVDIFCVPSREEPFGLVILEGFLFSTLVISSDTDGGKFLIKDGEDGLLFANENPRDLAKKISKILDEPEFYSSFTSKAFSKLEKEFSFDFLAREFQKILTKISQKNA
jgi:glycosyltransferase involved in cell wall biosynthesis